MAAGEAVRGWWKAQGRKFLLAALATAIVVVVAGWFTGMRDVMHGALLAVMVAAFLPFVIIAGVLLLLLGLAIVASLPALVGGEATPELVIGDARIVEDAGGLIRPYYRFLGRRRHPVFWGVPAGLVLGALVLWGVIAFVILPGEARTVERLAEANLAIERIYKETGHVPAPDASGHLVLDGRIVEDDFGNPIRYEVSGAWRLASWTLSSSGFEPSRAADDLCLAGQTKLAKWAERLRTVASLIEEMRKGTASTSDRLAGIRALRCPT